MSSSPQRIGYSFKKDEIEYVIIQRIHQLFGRATNKWKVGVGWLGPLCSHAGLQFSLSVLSCQFCVSCVPGGPPALDVTYCILQEMGELSCPQVMSTPGVISCLRISCFWCFQNCRPQLSKIFSSLLAVNSDKPGRSRDWR